MTKNMIAETVALKALLSETADHHILAEMLGFVADRLMALDVDQRCGAGTHERSTERVNHRNGDRERRWETRAGTVDVQIPKLPPQSEQVSPALLLKVHSEAGGTG